MAIVTTDNQHYSDIADAIRNKGVSGSFTPAQMAAAIEGIEGGGGGINLLDYCETSPKFATYFPSENPVLNAPICVSFNKVFYHDTGVSPYKSITLISNANVTDLGDACRTYRKTQELQTVTLDIPNLSKVTSYAALISNNTKCSAVLGTPLDFTSVTNANNSMWCRNSSYYADGEPMYVRYKPNTLHVNHNIAGEHTLTAESLISIANGLQSGNNTITLYADIKTLCTTITGSVSQVTDGDVTHDFFTEDASGSVTLENFITQTKGWTIA